MGVVNNRIDIDALEKSSGGGGGGGTEGLVSSVAYESPVGGISVSTLGLDVDLTLEFDDYKFILFEFGAYGKTASVLIDRERFEDDTPRPCSVCLFNSTTPVEYTIQAKMTDGVLTGATLTGSATTAFARIIIIK